MKKYSALLLIAAFALTLIACGPDYVSTTYTGPKNGIFDAPDEFYLEWDIPSVRDISVEKDGYYSMPVYMFETYEEFLHLKDIVGMYEIGSEIDSKDYCYICQTDAPCSHDRYNEDFFEDYTLLIGWHQYAGVILGEHIQEDDSSIDETPSTKGETDGESTTPDIEDETNGEGTTPDSESENAEPDVEAQSDNGGEAPSESPEQTPDETPEEIPEETPEETPENTPSKNASVAKYEIAPDGSLVVYLQGARAEGETPQQWILVAVPKNVMADCDSIAFLVKLPEEE